jgi:hypothetical protein
MKFYALCYYQYQYFFIIVRNIVIIKYLIHITKYNTTGAGIIIITKLKFRLNLLYLIIFTYISLIFYINNKICSEKCLKVII